MTAKRLCIVAGALGIAGRALVEYLEHQADWDVIALSRRTPDFASRAHFLCVDLTDSADCKQKLRAFKDVTHIFYTAFAPKPTVREEVAPNVAMLVNLVTSIEDISPRLRHVQVMQGSKWYGNHLGPYRTPAKEQDPRQMPPNFYYDQQDWLEERQRGKRWTWSALRPHCICGFSIGSPMNHLMALALYASISRELGLPLRFPGTPGAFRAAYQFTDASLLARAMVWAATNPACANQALNMTNGECERWENIWPAIADALGMNYDGVKTISLHEYMSDKEALWTRMRDKHNLMPYRLEELVSWKFADWSYSNSFDQISSLSKARRLGWGETLEADVMFRNLFGELQERRIIPL